MKKHLEKFAIGYVVLLLLIGWSSGAHRQAPDPGKASETTPDFSLEHASRHLETIAKSPHPIGSAAHREVFDYIVETLGSAGAGVTIQEETLVRTFNFNREVARVRNILVRFEGRQSSHTTLLTCHYDANPGSPGAGSGMAVAALLDAARVLAEGDRFEHDVIFLFADGGEIADYGVEAFIKRHPWAREVDLALVFDGLGTSGPVFLDKTTSESSALVDDIARAVPSLIASSMHKDVLETFTPPGAFELFAAERIPSALFMQRGDRTHAGNGLDRITEVDERTLAHHTAQALSLARYFGREGISETSVGNRVFFNLPLLGFLTYPQSWNTTLWGIAAALYLVALVGGVRKGKLHIGKLLAGFGSFVGITLVSVIVGMILRHLFLAAYPSPDGQAWPFLYRDAWYLYGLLFSVAAICLAAAGPLSRKLGPENLSMGFLFVWLVLAIVYSGLLPGTSYVFIWPLLFMVIGMLIALLQPEGSSPRGTLVLCVASLPILVFWVPLMASLQDNVPNTFLPFVVFTMVMAVGLPAAIIHELVPSRKWLWTAGSAAAGILLSLVGVLQNRSFDAAHPGRNSLSYVLDARSGEAHWFSTDRRRDDWTRQFLDQGYARVTLDEILPTAPLPIQRADAPLTDTPTPILEILEDEKVDGKRRVKVYLASARQGEMLRLMLPSVRFDGMKAGLEDLIAGGLDIRRVTFFGFAENGLEMEMVLDPDQPLEVSLLDFSYTLPAPASQNPRPEHMISTHEQKWFQNATIVIQDFTL